MVTKQRRKSLIERLEESVKIQLRNYYPRWKDDDFEADYVLENIYEMFETDIKRHEADFAEWVEEVREEMK